MLSTSMLFCVRVDEVEEKIAQEFLDKIFQTWFEEQLVPSTDEKLSQEIPL